MAKVAVLGSGVRLIVLKFLVRTDLVPAVIPRLPVNSSGVTPMIPGEVVLEPTSRMNLSNFVLDLLKPRSGYKLVGARVANERSDGKSDVRFTFCHEQFLNLSDPVHPNFSTNYAQLVEEFVKMVSSNLWLTQAHLNPYLENGLPTETASVLFLSSTERTPLFENGGQVLVHRDGRKKINDWSRGVGPKVPLITLAKKLEIVRNSSKGKEVQLV